MSSVDQMVEENVVAANATAAERVCHAAGCQCKGCGKYKGLYKLLDYLEHGQEKQLLMDRETAKAKAAVIDRLFYEGEAVSTTESESEYEAESSTQEVVWRPLPYCMG